MGKGHRRCEVCGMKEAWHTGNRLLFSKFPLDPNRCREWLKAAGNEELVHLPIEKLHEHRNVCANHFGKKDFNKKGNRLKRHAIPTLNLMALPLTDEQLVEFPQHLFRHSESNDSCPPAATEQDEDIQEVDLVAVPTETSLPVQVPTVLCEPTNESQKVCRVCLAMDVKMYDLNDIELREMFQNITGIAVTENNHPILERLCWECAGRLKAAAAFRNKALLSDALLQGLANNGEQIRKHDITIIKDSEDYLKTAATLTAVEAFHIVDIDPENDGIPPLSENNDTKIVQNTVRKDFFELKNEVTKKERVIEEDNDQTDVKDVAMIEDPINTEMEYDQFDRTCPNDGEESSNVFVETKPLFSNNIPLEEDTINSANSSPPPSCSHVKPKNPVLGYRLKTPGYCEDTIQNHVIKITKGDSNSKIVFINSKELISAKSKNINVKIGGISKKTSNLKLTKNTQVKANTPRDEESLRLEDFEF